MFLQERERERYENKVQREGWPQAEYRRSCLRIQCCVYAFVNGSCDGGADLAVFYKVSARRRRNNSGFLPQGETVIGLLNGARRAIKGLSRAPPFTRNRTWGMARAEGGGGRGRGEAL